MGTSCLELRSESRTLRPAGHAARRRCKPVSLSTDFQNPAAAQQDRVQDCRETQGVAASTALALWARGGAPVAAHGREYLRALQLGQLGVAPEQRRAARVRQRVQVWPPRRARRGALGQQEQRQLQPGLQAGHERAQRGARDGVRGQPGARRHAEQRLAPPAHEARARSDTYASSIPNGGTGGCKKGHGMASEAPEVACGAICRCSSAPAKQSTVVQELPSTWPQGVR